MEDNQKIIEAIEAAQRAIEAAMTLFKANTINIYNGYSKVEPAYVCATTPIYSQSNAVEAAVERVLVRRDEEQQIRNDRLSAFLEQQTKADGEMIARYTAVVTPEVKRG